MSRPQHNECALYLQIAGSDGLDCGPVAMFVAGAAVHPQRNSGAVISNTSAFTCYKCTVYVDNLEATALDCDMEAEPCVATRCLCSLSNWRKIHLEGVSFFLIHYQLQMTCNA